MARRSCSKQTCNRDAVCTLTYVYSDSTAVIGALSARREPHAYDLCPVHADTLTAPRGWRVVRLEAPGGWDRDDLDDVVQAVRADDQPAARRVSTRGPSLGAARPNPVPGARVLRDVSYRGDDEAGDGEATGGAPRSDQVPGHDASVGPHSTPRGGGGAPDDGYPGASRSVAKAHSAAEPPARSVPVPESLRIPHWRRP
ncbi:DUF3499 family protein [Kocuria tytonicola]|uniref:DUF3499 family protein n=1 Tax=Kocuria tytonicola TaxID=2055946 RepID=UPI001F0C417F|nr:DUF3499 family protein [Kocuria tytonicola]